MGGLISLIGLFGGLVSDVADGWLNLKFDSCGLIGGFKSRAVDLFCFYKPRYLEVLWLPRTKITVDFMCLYLYNIKMELRNILMIRNFTLYKDKSQTSFSWVLPSYSTYF